ncbi:trigger factor [Litoribrevibacter albus]|uniref:Trigger factor n=1 Tax=Litoribrevibacter albus TaxID=1473156 RepID=A0AA37SD00_9GAMM|nr:trigger factor [Litoribrevibacter albus]GLQ32284.1 trigger factor [Litoribrevibacter albus]
MQVSVETTSGLERKMTVAIPSDRIDSEVETRLKDTAKRVRIDGFRPGKVPMREVKRRYGLGVRQEVLSELMRSTYFEAVMQEKLNPAGAPSIEPVDLTEDSGFSYVATFEVYPEFEVKGMDAVEVTRPNVEISDEDVSEMIDILRKQQATWEEVEREAADGDRVTIDYVGTKDGVEFDGGKAENAPLTLGSNTFIPGFEDGLVGTKAGEEKVLDLTFPEDYGNKDLAGAAVQFAVTVKAVSEQKLPELNDEFYARFGVEGNDEESFRAEVKKNMERELDQAVKTKVKNQVMDGLIEQNDVDVPAALVSEEIDRMRQQAVQQFGGGQGFDPKSLPAEMFQDQAKKRVHVGLVVAEIIKANELSADEEKVDAMLNEMASVYQEPQQVIDWYKNNPEQLNQLKAVVLEEQVVEKVLESAKVEEKEMSYQDAVKPEGQA